MRPSEVPPTLFEGTGEPLTSTRSEGSSLTAFPTSDGIQTIISIDSASSAHRYEFALDLPDGVSPKLENNGSVTLLDQGGRIVGGYEKPWAKDAKGKAVATEFALEGSHLVQTVHHTATSAFPVIADPNGWWGWTMCIAAVGVAVSPWGAGAGLAWRLITRFGSVARGVEIIWRAWNTYSDWNRRWKAASRASQGLFVELIGIEQIRTSCFD